MFDLINDFEFEFGMQINYATRSATAISIQYTHKQGRP